LEDLIESDENDDLPQEFIDYFTNNYVGPQRGRGANRRRLAPKFAIHEWNVLGRLKEGSPRTNNNLEGFHNALNSSITQTHPNIWTLIKGLMSEEHLAAAKVAEVEIIHFSWATTTGVAV
jgi:hypothetical protein